MTVVVVVVVVVMVVASYVPEEFRIIFVVRRVWRKKNRATHTHTHTHGVGLHEHLDEIRLRYFPTT